MEYHNLDLEFSKSTDTEYKVRVLNSEAGEDASDAFSLPFSEEKKQLHFRDINDAIRDLGPGDSTTRFDESGRDVFSLAKQMGGELYQAVFKNDVKEKLNDSIKLATQKDALLRIRLRFSQALELAALPWEQLYDGRHFLGIKSKDVSIVRYIENSDPIPSLRVTLPLRVLAVVSRSGRPLDYEAELRNLRNAISRLPRELMTLDLLDNVTHESLGKKLNDNDYHVFHYIGHGVFDHTAKRGFLRLNDKRIDGEHLGITLTHKGTVRLAIINACEGGQPAEDKTYAGVAQSLIQQGIPAVVAMQFKISDSAAIKFADEFYYSIVTGKSVETALSIARLALFSKGPEYGEWATPVLYSRAKDGNLFVLPPEALNFEAPEREVLEIELPVAPPSFAISSASPFYVKRSIDEQIGTLLMKPAQGVTISIWAGGQVGKSSLLKSVGEMVADCKKKAAYVNFQSDFDSKHLTSPAKFHRHFCRVLADKLGLPDRLDAHWKLQELSVVQRCARNVDYLLRMLQQPVVLILDDVDQLIQTEIRSSFFKTLRSWRDGPENFERMDIVWVSASDPNSFFPATLLSLEDFSEKEIVALGQRYGVSVGEDQARTLKISLGGAPFLLHLAFFEAATNQNRKIDTLISELNSEDPPNDAGLFSRDLMSKYTLLRQNQKMRDVVTFISGNTMSGWATIPLDAKLDEQVLWQLHQAGLIARAGNKVKLRCGLYEKYFHQYLTRK